MKQFSSPASIAMLLMTWPMPSLSHPQLEVLVQSAIIIQIPPVPAYRLRHQVTELAHDGDRLDTVGMAAQSAALPMVLDLDRDHDLRSIPRSPRQIRLAPHSRIRIIEIQPLANGQKRVRLAVEQGQAKLQIHWFQEIRCCDWWRFNRRGENSRKAHPNVHPWYLNGLRASSWFLLTEQSKVERLG